MDAQQSRSSLGVPLLAGGAYLLVGRLFALPTEHVHAWRLAAWLVSGVVYAAQIAYEHSRPRASLRGAAWRVALGVAIGAAALALVGMIGHWTSGQYRWLLALLVWPAATGIPAFFGAFVALALLRRVFPMRAEAT